MFGNQRDFTDVRINWFDGADLCCLQIWRQYYRLCGKMYTGIFTAGIFYPSTLGTSTILNGVHCRILDNDIHVVAN